MKKLSKSAIVFSMIKDKIAKGELKNGDRLSPVRVLAVEFNVSDDTIMESFDLLEKEKLITRIQKSGIYIGFKNKNEPTSCKKVPAKTRAQEIAESIILQIVHGVLKIGEYLTLKKVLVFKYGTSIRSINKAIEILVEKKYIHKDGFRYRIGKPTPSALQPVKNHVYILAKQSPAGWKFASVYDRVFFKPFEHELQNRGVTEFEYLNEPDLINRVEKATTAGFLMDFNNLSAGSNEPEKLLNWFYKTVDAISKKQLPLVVNSYNNILRRFPDFTLKPASNLFFIGYDDCEAGENVGSYLVSMGHKQIAYFNFGNIPCNFQRFQGAQRALKRHFMSGSNVHYFHNESDDASWSADLSTYRHTSGEDKKRFLESYSGLFKGYQFQMDDPVVGIYPFLANQILKDINKKKMAPVFEKGLKMKEITAWIGASENVTLAAAEFLMERGVDIPNEISLIGFGDEKTMEFGITSYDLADSKAGYLAAHCILGDIPIKKNRKGYVEYEGQIMVRKSVKAI
jgi:DNA-binding transcriptional regulator YhcF (GntR family)